MKITLTLTLTLIMFLSLASNAKNYKYKCAVYSHSDKKKLCLDYFDEEVKCQRIPHKTEYTYGANVHRHFVGNAVQDATYGAIGGGMVGSAVPGVGSTVGAFAGGAVGAVEGLARSALQGNHKKYCNDKKGKSLVEKLSANEHLTIYQNAKITRINCRYEVRINTMGDNRKVGSKKWKRCSF
jgi:outer membrane lipoprotein SlyB